MKPIHSFEGWLMPKEKYIAAMLRSIGITEFTGHTSHEKVKHPGVPTTWCGHSLGGHSALLHAKPGDLVLCFDPRHQSAASYLDFLIPFQKPFTAPKGVKVYNFYRNGFLPGYSVTGAVENKNMGLFVSHSAVPKAAAGDVARILGGMK